MPATGPRSVRVSPLDVMHSGARLRSVIGPIEPVDHAAAKRRLDELASSGPAARVGLQPDRTTTQWSFTPDANGVSFDSFPEPSCAAELLTTVVNNPSAAPIRVISAGRFLSTEHDHGLGEVEFALALHEWILGVGAPLPSGQLRPPVGSLAALVLGRHPLRTAALLSTGGQPSPVEQEATPDDAFVDWTPQPAAFMVTMPADVVAELRERRRRTQDREGVSAAPSLFAEITAATYRALARELDVHRSITIPFDCRRYLSQRADLWGNFVAGLQFEVARELSASTLHAMLRSAAVSGRPIANVALGAAKTWVALRRGILPTAAGQVCVHPRARLLFSHMGTVPRRRDTGLDPTEYIAHSDADGPEVITVSSATVAGTIQSAISFHANVFPREILENVFARVYRDPLNIG